MPTCITCRKKLESAQEVTKHLIEGHVVFTRPNEPIEGSTTPFGVGEPEDLVENLIEKWEKKKRGADKKV